MKGLCQGGEDTEKEGEERALMDRKRKRQRERERQEIADRIT